MMLLQYWNCLMASFSCSQLLVVYGLSRIGCFQLLLGILRLCYTPNIRGGVGRLLGVGFVFEDDLVVVSGVLDAMAD